MLTDSVLKDIMDAVDRAAKSGGLRPQRVDLKQLLPIQRCVRCADRESLCSVRARVPLHTTARPLSRGPCALLGHA